MSTKEIYLNFVKNYPFYYKLYKHLKNSFSDNTLYLKFDDDDFFECITRDYKTNNKHIFYYEISNNEELEERTNDYIKENICYIYPNISNYERCLKDKYYNDYDFNNNMTKETIYILGLCLKYDKPNKIYNMLDLETFKYNYFKFNSLKDLLNININFIDEDFDDKKILICYEP
jgi:hypothetical protein